MALVNSFDSFIFDYGGVLVKPQSDSAQAAMAKIVNAPLDRFHDLYWARRIDYDRGALTADEYWHDVARQTGTTLDAAAIEELIRFDTTGWMQFDEVMWSWLAELRQQGKRLAMLSNMPRELGEALKTQTDRLQVFDFVTLSYELHVVKPDAAIYEQCLEGLDATPDRTIFFDDKIENVQGAEQLGMRAIQFLDRDHILLQVR
jgi:putative hydrolase of the HAD superfamily